MSEEEFLLKWNNHQSNFVDVFSDLLRDEAFVDVTLVCGGEAVPGHKMVLSACSPLLQRILRENPCKHPVIILNDVSAPDMRSMMRFIYQGEVSVSQNELAGFLKTADNLQIKGLAEDKPANLVYLDKDKDNPEKKRKDKDHDFHRNDTSINNNNNTSSKPSKRQRLSTNNNTIPNNLSPEEFNNISPVHITNNAGYSPSAPRASAATTPHHISPGVVHHGRSSHQRSNADSHSSSHRRSRDNNKLNIGKSDMVEDLSCKVIRDSSAHLSNIPLNKSSLLSSLQPHLNSLHPHLNTNSITIEPAVTTTTLPVKDENLLVKTEPLDLVGEMVWSEGRSSINNKLEEDRGESGDGEVPMIPLAALGGALEGVAAAFCDSPVGLHSLDGGDEVKYEEESRGDASTGSDDANTNATTAPFHDDAAGCASNSIFDDVKMSMDLSKTNISKSDVVIDEQRENENSSPIPLEQVSLPLVLPPLSAMTVPGAVAATQPSLTSPAALPLPHPLQLLHHQQLQLRHNQFLLQDQQQRTQQKQLIESNPGSSVSAASLDGSNNSLVVTASNNNNNNLHKCRLCPFTTSNPYTFTRHLRIHTGNKEFRCRVCHFASSRKDSLIRHFRMKHLMGEMALYQEMDSKDIEELALLKDDESRPWYKAD